MKMFQYFLLHRRDRDGLRILYRENVENIFKVMHIKVISNYAPAAFLATSNRLISRRRLSKIMHNNNGTTFKGADS